MQDLLGHSILLCSRRLRTILQGPREVGNLLVWRHFLKITGLSQLWRLIIILIELVVLGCRTLCTHDNLVLLVFQLNGLLVIQESPVGVNVVSYRDMGKACRSRVLGEARVKEVAP